MKTRRARLQPADVGLSTTSGQRGRRTPGLRRSEVARLAGISTEWYTLFEMGRARAMNMRIIDPVSNALRLTSVERDYLHDLVLAAPPPRRTIHALHPSIEFALARVKEAATAVYDPWLTRIRWNGVAREIFMISDGEWLNRNALVRSFKDQEFRRIGGPEWGTHARHNLGIFRRALARDPLNASAHAVMKALKGIPEFDELWAAHEVYSFDLYSNDNAGAPYVLRHPKYGDVSIHIIIIEIPGWPGASVRYVTPADERGVQVFRDAASQK